MTSQIRKFAFDTEFTPDGAVLRESAPGPRRFSSEDMEAARQAAYASGRDDALAAAERANAQALADLAAQAAALLGALEAQAQAMRAEAGALALAAARKIAGAALDQFGETRILAAIDAAMDGLRHGPRLLVRLAPNHVEPLKPRIAELTQAHLYPNAVIVRAEPAMKNGDVSIDWADGLIAIEADDIAARIEKRIASALHGAAEGDAA
ncbi:MAG: FliH/SctL family protein [Hyphomonadaceae bacterium]